MLHYWLFKPSARFRVQFLSELPVGWGRAELGVIGVAMDSYYACSSSKQYMLPILRSIANCSYVSLIPTLSCQLMSIDATLFRQMLWYLLHLSVAPFAFVEWSEVSRTLLSIWYFHRRCISRERTVNFIACCSFAFCLAKYLAIDSSWRCFLSCQSGRQHVSK